MKKHFTIILVFLSIAFYSNGQAELKNGYILLLNGDTIYGQINNQNYYSNSIECEFKKNNTDSIITFSPNQIKGYRFLDGKYYRSMTIPTNKSTENVFLEYLLNGQLSMFFRQDQDGVNHYFISKDTMPLTELLYTKEIVEIDGKTYLHEKKEANGVLSYYMSDCPSIMYEVQSLKEPSHESLIKIGKKYHNLVCTDHQCIIYEKKPKINIKLGISAGTSYFFSNTEGANKTAGPSGGFNFLFQRSEISERLYFGVGLLVDGIIENGYLLSMPLSINYIHPKQKLSPYASVSFDINRFSPAYALSLGIQNRYKRISFLLIGELKAIKILTPYGSAIRLCMMFDLKK